MRHFGYPDTVATRSPAEARTAAPPLTKTIPFDYVFEFKLQGKSANNVQDVVKVQDVVEISMQGVFVGVSLGYSFVLNEREKPRAFEPVIDATTNPSRPVAIPVFEPGFTEFNSILISAVPGAHVAILTLDSPGAVPKVVPVTLAPDGTAVQPVTQQTRMLQVWDKTNNLSSQPLQKGGPSLIGPNPVTLRPPTVGDAFVYAYGETGTTSTVRLVDRNSQVQDLLNSKFDALRNFAISRPGLNLAPPFELIRRSISRELGVCEVTVPNKLAAGDILSVQSGTGPVTLFTVPSLRPSTLTLGAIAAGLANINVGLSSGFRLSQRFANIFAADVPLNEIDPDIVRSAFEPACGPEDVSFLYSIDVLSTGRELQNKPIHNIAGLGIANGDRPFRPLARPIALEPRTSIRIQVEEISTLKGTLYIVLQGYKILGTGRIPE